MWRVWIEAGSPVQAGVSASAVLASAPRSSSAAMQMDTNRLCDLDMLPPPL
jgi:hypothetical protein